MRRLLEVRGHFGGSRRTRLPGGRLLPRKGAPAAQITGHRSARLASVIAVAVLAERLAERARAQGCGVGVSRGPGATPAGHVPCYLRTVRSWPLANGFPLLGRLSLPSAPVRLAACLRSTPPREHLPTEQNGSTKCRLGRTCARISDRWARLRGSPTDELRRSRVVIRDDLAPGYRLSAVEHWVVFWRCSPDRQRAVVRRMRAWPLRVQPDGANLHASRYSGRARVGSRSVGNGNGEHEQAIL
jgi:hypothetical protein